jgi:HD-GYP domain-containing protein (c-di-GMP phosphodiesterase class II)/DNA-binding CsgD family transcriptional regulator
VAEARLADLLAGLSGFADVGFGLPAGTALRSCALATQLARALDLPAADVRAAFYTALLHHVGCAGYAHETARLFGDELVANQAAGRTDAASGWDLVATFLPALTRGRPPVDKARLTLAAFTRGARWAEEYTTTACEVGRDTARRLRLPDEVQASLFHVYDLWRGKGGGPGARQGDDIPVGARIARLTGIAALFASFGGSDLAVHAVRRRSGGMLDPGLVARFTDRAADWLGALAETDARDLVRDLEPDPPATVPDARSVAEVFADLVDLKSPYLLGHSRSVAALAGGAAQRLHLPADATRDLEVAGLLHDVGRVAVSNAVWDKPGRLSTEDWEQVRLHPYHSERILAGSAELARLAPLVGRHHERLDGSGYHRGSHADDLSVPARVLAAADRYRTLVEDRPHRPALAPDEAGERLLADAGRGALDGDAVQAVLAAAGHPVSAPRRRRPEGLSDREVEVLGLLARGCSNAEIASRLAISRRTAEHHVQHIYTKIGVSSRAAATLFAVEHDLVARQ